MTTDPTYDALTPDADYRKAWGPGSETWAETPPTASVVDPKQDRRARLYEGCDHENGVCFGVRIDGRDYYATNEAWENRHIEEEG